MSAVALARMVIETLNAQQRYFKSRSREDLIASKQLEVKLLKTCEVVIDAATPPVENSIKAIACELCNGEGSYERPFVCGPDIICPRCHGSGHDPS